MAPNPTETDNMSDELTPSDRTGVSFAAPVDNEEPAYRKKSSQELRSAKARQSLSASAKAWDLDGDGELDDTEMALRNLDKSHKGTLSKDQMYELMADNLHTQRELFKVKKVVIGLVAFTCVLALCNLGTSFAAAFLAKDTSTVNGKFVDSHTGNTLKTDSSATTMSIDNELTDANRRQRRLACEAVRRLAKPTDPPTDPTNYGCAVAPNAVSMEDGEAIVNGCHDGGAVNVVKNFNSGSNPGPIHTVCQLGDGYSVTYDRVNGDQGAKYPTMSVVHNNQQIINISPNADLAFYEITGLYSQGTEACDSTDDCATDLDLTCESNVCTAPATTTTSSTAAAIPDPVCDSNFDSGFVSQPCDAADATLVCSWAETCPDGSEPRGECTCTGTIRDGLPTYEWGNCMTPTCLAPVMDEPMPVGGGAAAPGSPCSSDGDCEASNHFCINTAYTNDEGRCGQCDPYNTTATGCEGTNVPSCSELDGLGVGDCQCDVLNSSDCPGAQTCNAPSCIGMSNYCSDDHDADHGCTTTTLATRPTV